MVPNMCKSPANLLLNPGFWGAFNTCLMWEGWDWKLAKAVVNALCTDQNCTCTSYWQKRPQRSRMNVMGLVSWFSHKKQQLTSALSSGPLQPSCDGAIAADKFHRTERSNRVQLRCMVGNQKVDCKYSKHIRIVIYINIYIYITIL